MNAVQLVLLWVLVTQVVRVLGTFDDDYDIDGQPGIETVNKEVVKQGKTFFYSSPSISFNSGEAKSEGPSVELPKNEEPDHVFTLSIGLWDLFLLALFVLSMIGKC